MTNTNQGKPLLLVFPFNILAHYLRCITLANGLSSMFEIKFLHSPEYASFVDEAGYKTFSCKTFNAHTVLKRIRSFDFTWLNETDIEDILLGQVRVINELKPAAVLGDTLPTLKMAAEKAGVTAVSLLNGYISRYYMHVHPMPLNHPLHAVLKLLPEKLQEQFIKIGEQRSFEQIHQPFKKLRQRYKLTPQYSYEDELEGDINLLCDLPVLFPQKDLPKNYHFIRPLYYHSSFNSTRIVSKLDKRKKTLFVSMGSTGSWQNAAFLNNRHFDKYNIITAGDEENIVNGPNVIKATFVNVADVFPYTDLVICHGGNGTIYQALSFGIPLLCETSYFEQEWNVHAVERLHVGQTLDLVKNENEYYRLVDEWVDKKDSPVLSDIKQQIGTAKLNFHNALAEAFSSFTMNNEPAFSPAILNAS